MTEKNSRIKFVRINWLHQLGNYFRYPYSRQISGLGFQILDILILAKYQDQGFKFQISLPQPNIRIRVSNFRYPYPSQISGLGFQIRYPYPSKISELGFQIRYPYPSQISGLGFHILDILILSKYQDQGFKFQISLSQPNIRIWVSNLDP